MLLIDLEGSKSSLFLTWEEESRVLLDAPSIYFNHVSKNMINPDVFSDKVKMYLDDIDYIPRLHDDYIDSIYKEVKINVEH